MFVISDNDKILQGLSFEFGVVKQLLFFCNSAHSRSRDGEESSVIIKIFILAV